ncbi:hypothetical protein EC970010_1353A, partial [Escherichia coli 97.0010]|jgi:hypothetical protein
MVKY